MPRSPCTFGSVTRPRSPRGCRARFTRSYKVIYKVSDAEFERAKAFEDSVVLTEPALGGQEVAIAFKPREEWPKAFRFFKLYRCTG